MKTTTMKSLILSATALLTAMAFTSCSKESELDTIKDAQMCLNDATPSGAQACVSKLSGINTQQANQLKCSAYFIQEELGAVQLITALDNANSDNSCGSCSDSMAIISKLKFKSSGTPATNVANAASAFEVCSASGVAIYTQLASMVNIATVTGSLLPSNADADDYATAIAALNPTQIEALGGVVLETFTNSCESGAQNTEESQLQKYCGELEEITNGLTEAQIGACLREKLTGSNDVGCPLP